MLTKVSTTAQLSAGRQPVSVDINGHLIGATGSGTYHRTSFTATSAADPTQHASGIPLYILLGASQWLILN